MNSDTSIINHDLGDAKQVVIHVIADVHLGAEETDVLAFEQLVNRIAETPDHYCILAGDLIDNGLKSSVTNVYRATMRPAEQKKEMARMLLPVRGKILCIMPGNHEYRSAKESDDCPAYDIASKMDIEDLYRENIAILRVRVGQDKDWRKDTHGTIRRNSYYIGVVHGAGGGMYLGGTVNKNDAFMNAIDGLDVLVTAHVHKPYVSRGSKVWIDHNNGVVTQRPYLVIGAGSWLRFGGYAARKLMRPVALPGTDSFVLYGDKSWFEGVV